MQSGTCQWLAQNVIAVTGNLAEATPAQRCHRYPSLLIRNCAVTRYGVVHVNCKAFARRCAPTLMERSSTARVFTLVPGCSWSRSIHSAYAKNTQASYITQLLYNFVAREKARLPSGSLWCIHSHTTRNVLKYTYIFMQTWQPFLRRVNDLLFV